MILEYVKAVQQTITVQDFTFKTDSSFSIISLGNTRHRASTSTRWHFAFSAILS